MTHLQVQDGSFVSHSARNNAPRVHEVLDRAHALLQQLRAARRTTEQRLSEAGRADPLKTVTGRSSLDNAIDCTEQLICEMHAIDDDRAPAPVMINSSVCRELLHCADRNGHNNGNPAERRHARTTTTLNR